MNPAACALRILSTNSHPPLIISKYPELMLSLVKVLVKGEQASTGDARNIVPCSPDPVTGRPEKEKIQSFYLMNVQEK